ncbi:MAG: hypothetical protein HY508_14795 [Acidobacteria bacterium]|nr:hypothetical protein [Acidobacteriota bacterium]
MDKGWVKLLAEIAATAIPLLVEHWPSGPPQPSIPASHWPATAWTLSRFV